MAGSNKSISTVATSAVADHTFLGTIGHTCDTFSNTSKLAKTAASSSGAAGRKKGSGRWSRGVSRQGRRERPSVHVTIECISSVKGSLFDSR